MLDEDKMAQLAKVAISTLKAETLLKQFVRLPDIVGPERPTELEQLLDTILEEEGWTKEPDDFTEVKVDNG